MFPSGFAASENGFTCVNPELGRSVRFAAAALAGFPGLGSRGLFRALEALAGTGRKGFFEFLSRHRAFSAGNIEWVRDFKFILSRGEETLADLESSGTSFITPWDDSFPPGLRYLENPPPFLMLRGRFPEFNVPWISVVGSRGPVAKSLAAAREIGKFLGDGKVPVVSGLARGIDAAGHAGCLEAGGRTVAVMGTGLSVIYPPEHTELAVEIARSGAVVSELPAEAGPEKWTFVSRNRIIAGMSTAVVVVAAGQDSGSLRTAAVAAELGRLVVVIVEPGSPLTHGGGKEMAGKGRAVAVRSPEEAVDVLMNGPLIGLSLDKSKALSVYNNISIMNAGENSLAGFIRDGDTPEDVTARSGMAPGNVLAGLMKLEMDGFLRMTSDGTIFLEYRGRIK